MKRFLVGLVLAAMVCAAPTLAIAQNNTNNAPLDPRAALSIIQGLQLADRAQLLYGSESAGNGRATGVYMNMYNDPRLLNYPWSNFDYQSAPPTLRQSDAGYSTPNTIYFNTLPGSSSRIVPDFYGYPMHR